VRHDENEALERRQFFSQLFRRGAKPIASLLDKKLSKAQKLADMIEQDQLAESAKSAEAPASPLLRPPGALPEDKFVNTCSMTGQCVRACPVRAIKQTPPDDSRGGMTPYIEPELQACVICEELACMKACPSGALNLVPREEIRMGQAVIDYDLCLRVSGDDCQDCVENCPIGEAAIHLDSEHGSVEIEDAGCVGCGKCVMVCPADPNALMIEPRLSSQANS
jgi:ferredoxin-type protein NapG